jgi:hypothetical protein
MAHLPFINFRASTKVVQYYSKYEMYGLSRRTSELVFFLKTTSELVSCLFVTRTCELDLRYTSISRFLSFHII